MADEHRHGRHRPRAGIGVDETDGTESRHRKGLLVSFECLPRGPVEVKGKGAVEGWFLQGRRSAPARPSSVAEVVPAGIGATR